MLPTVTGDFRAIDDPVLKFAPSGTAYCNVRAVADKKKKNEATGEWEDDKVIFVNITGFKKVAENMAESITKGVTMTVQGQISARQYETKDGESRTSIDITANSIGVSLQWDPVTVQKAERGAPAAAPAAQPDPWSTAPATAPATQADEPPF